MLARRKALAFIAFLALSAPALARAEGAEKKKGGGISFIQFPTLTATVFRADGRRGVLTVEAGVDVPDAGLRARVNLYEPRLRAAYVQLLQDYVYALGPGAPPNPDYLEQILQRQTDQLMGRSGARLLLGTMLIN
ncbi:MAG TPA: Tat pathway signal protein [Caulobacteraceae bacterium]|nr:Tat pathway signal protein [Caulobacteraceae bacterium]